MKSHRFIFYTGILLFVFSLYLSIRVIYHSGLYQSCLTDKAEVSSIRYGILNADEWEESLAVIITNKVEEFELTPENRDQLRSQVENILYRLLDEVNQILQNDMGSVKRFLVKTFVDLDKLRESVPELSDALLEELAKPENKDNLKEYILQKLDSFVSEIYNLDEQIKLKGLLDKYESEDKETAFARLESIESNLLNTLRIDTILLISFLVLSFFLNSLLVKKEFFNGFYVMLAVVFVFLIAGVSIPMINIEAKISRLTFQLLGEPIVFEDQVLFFQSKSILDVVWILIKTWKPDMVVVGIMIFSFSVLFPATKILCTYLSLKNPGKFKDNKFVYFFTFKSGKWSMADVFVVAIFMAYIAFNGIVASQLSHLSNVYDNVEILTTNGTALQVGFYLFLLFCISGLLLSDAINNRMPNFKN